MGKTFEALGVIKYFELCNHNLEELQDLITDDLKYRDKQLLRLKDEILDLEDFNENITLSEFTLDDFRMELAKYIEANRAKLEQAPLGLYAVVPAHSDYQQIAPGAVFCLKQLENTSGNETVNPLQPYFLIYVRDDGIVRYTFAQPKQILQIYRMLCAGKTTPYEALCNLFDAETKNGSDMGLYSELLQKAVESIVHTFKKRALTGLLAGRGGVLPEASKQVSLTTDFELVTWLVIKESLKMPSPLMSSGGKMGNVCHCEARQRQSTLVQTRREVVIARSDKRRSNLRDGHGFASP